MILYADLDAYFASVEQALRPELKGKPVIVGGDPEARKGVVAAASYEAREYGVHAAQTIAEAKRLCPDCIFIMGNHRAYREFSRRFYSILRDYSPRLEVFSLDEAFLDISVTEKEFPGTLELAEDVRRRVKRELDITATIGVAKSRVVSKIAAKQVKPDGLIEVPMGKEEEYLSPLAISEYPGIGSRTERKLNGIDIYTIGDLLRHPLSDLYRRFGIVGARWVMDIHQEGIEEPVDRKSISKSHTMREDTKDIKQMYSLLYYLTEKVAAKLQKYNLYTSRVWVHIRSANFSDSSDYQKVPSMNLAREIYPVVKDIFNRMPKRWVRLLGVRASDLSKIPSLFQDKKKLHLEEQIQKIRGKYGFDSVLPLSTVKGKW